MTWASIVSWLTGRDDEPATVVEFRAMRAALGRATRTTTNPGRVIGPNHLPQGVDDDVTP